MSSSSTTSLSPTPKSRLSAPPPSVPSGPSCKAASLPFAPAHVGASLSRREQVLLLAGSPGIQALTGTLQGGLPGTVETVQDLEACLELLRTRQYTLLLLQQGFLPPELFPALLDAAGYAVVLELDFALCSASRVLQSARGALHRRATEEQRTRELALQALREEFASSATGLLLEAQLVLRLASAESQPALRRVVCLAEKLCKQLTIAVNTTPATTRAPAAKRPSISPARRRRNT